jgi:AhpD family alkylhydroperoxidase
MSNEPRFDYHRLAPKSSQALVAFSRAAAPDIEPRIRELLNLRVSQINGCAFCMDMHAAALAKMGVDQRVLNCVAGWREAHRLFSARDKAALLWAEAVNALPQRVPSDDELAAVRAEFKDEEISQLTFAVGAIRAWNMLNASSHMPVPPLPYAVSE